MSEDGRIPVVGDEYFSAWVNLGWGGDESGFSVDRWVVSSVRSGVVHTKNAHEYSDRTTKWRIADGPPKDFARSRSQAITLALPDVEAALKRLTKLRATMTGQRTVARKPKTKQPRRKARTAIETSSVGTPEGVNPNTPGKPSSASEGVGT